MQQITLTSKLENRGHYVPGMISGDKLYISGQLPVHHETGAPMADSIEQQTRDALHNVERVLLAAGCTKENVVYAAFFGSHKPARVIVPTRELHNGALVEIEAIAEVR